jgi:spermidine synthase
MRLRCAFESLFVFAVMITPSLGFSLDCKIAHYPEQPSKWDESVYNRMFLFQAGSCLKLTFRRVGMEWDESIRDLADPEALPNYYTRPLTAAIAYPSQLRSVVMLGLGGGTTLNYLSFYLKDTRFTAVELDPRVLEFARNDFQLAKNTQLHLVESDGRLFLLKTRETFDVIILDAYRGGYVPAHMLTAEFYKILRTHLSPDGVASINLHYGTELFDSSLKTIRASFPTVDVYPADANVVVIASNRPVDPVRLQSTAEVLQRKYRFRYSIPAMLTTRHDYQVPSNTPVLTDDFSPVNQLEQIKSINAEKHW